MTLYSQEYGSGPPLIILHGLLGSLDNWHTVSKTLGAFYRVFAVDQRDHGRSPHSDVFSYEAMSGDLREFFDHRHLTAAHVLGHSMGGKTAMQFALSYPERVERLIVVDIAPRAYSPLHDEIFDALLSLDLSHFSSRQEVETALAAKISDFAVRQVILKNLGRDESGAFQRKMNLPAIQRNYGEIARAIESNHPFAKSTLFIRSSRSGYILDSDVPDIRRLFPQSQIVRIEAGHWIHAEAPQEFLRIVLDFLGSP
jgi:pimeloyl-ACP methyl ester carboxylesterase